MELKLIAEVGLVGLPNAGKSTFLSVVSNAKPEIADYPFTTIRPNLGVAEVSRTRSLLIADIPGLISGASQGKGLGDDFLRHIERTKVLIHLIDAYQEDVANAYKTIKKELETYSKELSTRPEIVVLSKIDGLDDEIVNDQLKKLRKVIGRKTKIFKISSKTKTGIKGLLTEAMRQTKTEDEKLADKKEDKLPVIKLESEESAWQVEKKRSKYIVKGKKIEKFALRTNFNNSAGVERLRDIMRKMGIMHELERQKIEPENKILIGDKGEFGEFKY